MAKKSKSSAIWQEQAQQSFRPERARHFWEELLGHSAGASLRNASPEQARVFTQLFAGSQALSEWLVANPEAAIPALQAGALSNPRQAQGLRREIDQWLSPLLKKCDWTAALSQLRAFKQKEMVRIAARDLAGLGTVDSLIREISDVADSCLAAVYRICWQQLSERLGEPYAETDDGWIPVKGTVVGLGKLGGQELNYSSDVDVVFVYSEEGSVFRQRPSAGVSPGKGMSNHQFFNRLAEMFIAEVGRMTPEGMLYRIDLRLRPEGGAGPLTRSLASYENYYAQWGQSWERMMLIKARCVAGDASLAGEFLEMVQPFRYPRSIGEGLLREVAAMKDRIEQEVVRSGELDRNVKLGRGGIREIEFMAQTLQLLHAGRIPFLQGHQTLPTLDKLTQYGLLEAEDADNLACAYRFLRSLEHRLQMENNLQTHTIPAERKGREAIASLMHCASLPEFESQLKEHTQNVRRCFERLLHVESPETAARLPEDFDENEEDWKRLLERHAFRDVSRSFRMLQEFVHGPGYVHVSARTTDLARQLVPRFFAICPQPDLEKKLKERPDHVLSDPDRVLARLDSFVSAYGARAMLYETWTRNPPIFDLLLMLFDRSEFLAEAAIRTPDMVDELVLSGRLRRRKNAAEVLRELRFGLDDADQKLWLRNYHQTELMRIGLRDILQIADYEQNLGELSALADACLQYAVESVMRRRKLKQAPFAVLGLGKLGGSELNYGSDLDLVFVTDASPDALPPLQRLAIDVMDLLSSPTEHGIVFKTDARLRPDGEKGLLVNTLGAFEDYYRQRAQLWEIQSFSRIRHVAGCEPAGLQLERLLGAIANFSPASVEAGFSFQGRSGLAAFRKDWKKEIFRMRQRIEKERTPAGKDALAIKTGAGGIVDAEFVAQALCLERGWHEPNTLKALQKGLQAGALPGGELLIENYRKLRRVEAILRRWSFEGETVLPDDPAPMYRVSIRCGWPDSDAFLGAIRGYRDAIRKSFLEFFHER